MAFEGILIPLNYQVVGQQDINNLFASIKKIQENTDQLTASTKKLADTYTNGFVQARQILGGVQEVFSAMEGIFGTGVKKAMDYELQIAKLRGVLSSQGKDTGMVDQLEKMAGVMSKSSFFSKGEIVGVERLMFTFDNMSKTLIPQASAAAVGLATVMDVDLHTAALALGKALESPSEGFKSLRRLGVIFDQDTKDRITLLEDEGKGYEASALLLGEIERKYRDVAAAFKDTDAFKANQMEKTLSMLQKNAGAMELTIFSPLINGTKKFADQLNEMPKIVGGSIAAIIQLGAAYTLLDATGLLPGIKNLFQMGTSLNSYRLNALQAELATEGLTAAQLEQTTAEIAAISTNKGLIASMGAVGWAILGATALLAIWGMMPEEIDKGTEAIADNQKEIAKQQNAYNELARKIKDTTNSEQDRKKAIDDIEANYGDYLNHKKIDLANEKEMNDTLQHGNDLFDERIKKKGMENQLQKTSDDLAKLKIEKANLAEQKKNTSKDATSSKNIPIGIGGLAPAANNISTDVQAVQNLIDLKQSQIDAKEKEFQKISTLNASGEDDDKRTPEEKVRALMNKATGGLTRGALDKITSELQLLKPKLIAESALEKEVDAYIKKLGGKDRYSGTGGDTLKYFKEDTKIELDNVTQMADMYKALNTQWDKIAGIQVKDKKTGVLDAEKTERQKNKAKLDVRKEFESAADNLMRTKVKEAEVTTEAEGGSKLDVLKAKAQTVDSVISAVTEMQKKWNEEHPDYPIVSKVKILELGNQSIAAHNDINKELFDTDAKHLQNEEAEWDKFLENDKATDMERLEWKKTYLQAELVAAENYHQKEKAEEIQHKLDLLELDKSAVLERMKRRSEALVLDIKTGTAIRTRQANGSSYNSMQVDIAEENKKALGEQQSITDDKSLDKDGKKLALEEAEKTHQQRLLDIKQSYYSNWLEELSGLGKKEIESMSSIAQNLESAAGHIMDIQSAKAKKEADSYKKSEYDKLDTDKKVQLANARTSAQKQKIEDDYAKKKDAIDEEANKKAQEKIKFAFGLQKAVSIAGAVISTYKGATEAYSNVIMYPPPMNSILSASIVAAGFANVAAISAQEMPTYARGGYIDGLGTGTSDSNVVRVSHGEFIMNAEATRRYRMILEGMNATPSISSPSYASPSIRAGATRGTDAGNGALIAEMRAMRNELAEIKANVNKPSRAYLDDREAKKVTAKGLEKLKRQSA